MTYRDDPREQELRALRAECDALRAVVREYRIVATTMQRRDPDDACGIWRRTLARIDAALGGGR